MSDVVSILIGFFYFSQFGPFPSFRHYHKPTNKHDNTRNTQFYCNLYKSFIETSILPEMKNLYLYMQLAGEPQIFKENCEK